VNLRFSPGRVARFLGGILSLNRSALSGFPYKAAPCRLPPSDYLSAFSLSPSEALDFFPVIPRVGARVFFFFIEQLMRFPIVSS